MGKHYVNMLFLRRADRVKCMLAMIFRIHTHYVMQLLLITALLR